MHEHLSRAAEQAQDLERWLREYRSPVEEAMREQERAEVRRAFERAQRQQEQ